MNRPVRLLIALAVTFCVHTAAESVFPLRTNDVVAFVGGADVSAAQHQGHLESLLACAYPGARFRNFGWEGDTVFAQPRDFNFPPLVEHLRKAGVTAIVLQFGRAEALSNDSSDFKDSYRALLQQLQRVTTRVLLVIPPPLENPGGLLPNLSERNALLASHARAIRELSKDPVVDLFSVGWPERLTDDGLQLTPRGQALLAQAFARQIAIEDCARLAGPPDAGGSWSDAKFENLRQAIIGKNQIWFNYWRPQNWAFLGGDRTEQPSSRDHRDPKVRWFPQEIEQFRSLLNIQEEEVARLSLTLTRKKD